MNRSVYIIQVTARFRNQNIFALLFLNWRLVVPNSLLKALIHRYDESLFRTLVRCGNALAEGEAPEAAFVYFVPDARKEGGEYVSCTARVKRIDMPARRVILTDGREIPIDDILKIDCPALRGAEASL